MKIVFILFLIVLIGFVVIQLYALNEQRNIETYPNLVNKKFNDFEVRTYEASLFTSVKLSSSDYKESSRKGFSTLAGYIFGGNDKEEKISMTSPVAMSLGDSATMMFLVPKKNTSNLPVPNDSSIEFKQEPAKTVAAISFRGWADDQKIEAHKNKLIAALDRENISYTDKFYFLGYNAPYEMFNRKNEVIVELEDGALERIKRIAN